jgi:hypothetical protein
MVSSRYAERTSVPSSRTAAEIGDLVRKHGAKQFIAGWDDGRDQAAVEFVLGKRRIRFLLPVPNRQAREFTHTPARGYRRDPAEIDRVYEQAVRQRWRALYLVIRAKLEAVTAGITTIEDEFLAQTVLPDGSTVGEWARGQIDAAYSVGEMPALLPGVAAS